MDIQVPSRDFCGAGVVVWVAGIACSDSLELEAAHCSTRRMTGLIDKIHLGVAPDGLVHGVRRVKADQMDAGPCVCV